MSLITWQCLVNALIAEPIAEVDFGAELYRSSDLLGRKHLDGLVVPKLLELLPVGEDTRTHARRCLHNFLPKKFASMTSLCVDELAGVSLCTRL